MISLGKLSQLVFRFRMKVLPGYEPQTPFIQLRSTSPEIKLISIIRWLNWNDAQKDIYLANIMASGMASVAVTRKGIWIKYMPILVSTKEPVVFFVQILE